MDLLKHKGKGEINAKAENTTANCLKLKVAKGNTINAKFDSNYLKSLKMIYPFTSLSLPIIIFKVFIKCQYVNTSK